MQHVTMVLISLQPNRRPDIVWKSTYSYRTDRRQSEPKSITYLKPLNHLKTLMT